MTAHDDFDRTLADWLDADALPPAPTGSLDQVLDATRRRRPRPSWLAGRGSHWVGAVLEADPSAAARTIPWWGVRLSTALLLLLLVVALVGGAILVGARLFQPPPRRPFPLGQLAYGLNGNIYLADWDGRNPVKIADGGQNSTCGGYAEPTWSPNDRYLEFGSAFGDPCVGALVIYDTETRRSVSFPGEGWVPSWSPDSTRLATWVDVFNTVGIYGVDGVRQALLAVPPGCAAAGDYDFSWVADGTSLVGRSCNLPVDGRAAARLPTTDPRAHTPWADSPDGTRVAYVTNVATRSELVDTAADGTLAPRVLIPTGIVGSGPPIWSPNGDRIAFTGGTGPPDDIPELISVVDVRSQVVTPLASAPAADSLQIVGFSSQGDRILYGIFDGNGDGMSLWSVDADGSDARLLVTGTGWGDWQP